MEADNDRSNQEFGEHSDGEETPIIYSIQRDGNNFKYKRRNFLIKAGAVSAAAMLVGVGIDSITSLPNSIPHEGIPDEAGAIKLGVSLTGMSAVAVGETFLRTWQLVNTGENWCEGALLHLFEQNAPELAKVLPIPAIAPGESTNISVELVAPDEAGKYSFNWRIQIRNGLGKTNEFPLMVMQAVLAQTAHPYTDNMDDTWTLDNPDTGAAFSQVHFTRVETETSGTVVFDYLEVQDGAGRVVQTLSGNYPTGLNSNKVAGSVINLHFISDSSITYWGFAVDSIFTSAEINNFIFLPIIRRIAPTPTSYVTCTCNTVDVCTCNLVCTCDTVCSCVGYCSCDTVCSCVGHCSCNRVCTCDSVCTCQGNHYWYPN